MAQTTRPAPTGRHSARSSVLKQARQNWELYLFLLIPVAFIIIFHYVPMIGVQIAFRKYRIADGIWGSKWVGFAQFTKFFKSPQFKTIVPNTIILSLYGLIANFPIPIILALALNVLRNKRFKMTIQMISYMPHFISTVVLVGMLIAILNPRIGMYGIMYRALNNGQSPKDLMGQANAFRHLYVWSGVWQNMGWSSIIYLAALSAVDTELHEAAQIDGASRFQRVLHIDFPVILPTAIILLIMSTGNVLSVGYEKVYLMQNDLNLGMSEIISTYVYKVGLANAQYSYSTAIGLFNNVVNVAILLTVNKIADKVSGTALL